MKTAMQMIRENESVMTMAKEYSVKYTYNGLYDEEKAMETTLCIVEEVFTRKLNGRPAISKSSWGRVEDNAEFAKKVYEMLDATPQIGMACTEILYSDKYAYEVVEVVSGKKIRVRQKNYNVIDCYDGEAEVLDDWYDDCLLTFTLRKNGGWVMEGQPNKFGSVRLALGYGRTYVDPSF